MHILVIGGTGFLGRAFAEDAVALGHEVTIVDRRPPRAWRLAERLKIHVADVTRREELAEVFSLTEPDAVVYLAAFGTGGAGLLTSAQADPDAAVRVNVGGLLLTMQLCRQHRIHKLVWTSSTTVLGRAGMYPAEAVDESALVGPASVYGATKVLGEQLSAALAPEYGMQINALRPTMVWGPGVQYRGIQSSGTLTVDLGSILDGQDRAVGSFRVPLATLNRHAFITRRPPPAPKTALTLPGSTSPG